MTERAKFRYTEKEDVFLSVNGSVTVREVYSPTFRFWKKPTYRVRVTGCTIFEDKTKRIISGRLMERERRHTHSGRGKRCRQLIEENLYEVAKEVSQVSNGYFGKMNMYRRLMWSIITGSEAPENLDGERFISTPV